MARISSLSLLASLVSLSLMTAANPLEERQSTTKPVFAHFMGGIVKTFSQSTWESEMNIAKSIGIDAFAINIGKDDWNDAQLTNGYAAAAATGFKVFISFDHAYWTAGDVNPMSDLLKKFATRPGQFTWNNRIFVSSFVGDGFNYRNLETVSGLSLFACPSWQPGSFINNNNADCGMSWNAAWPNTNNQPIGTNLTTSLDEEYIRDLGGKPYMMPVSPWFNTHYGGDTFNKNWIFYSDWLFQTRWDQALQLNPGFIEILTWNDYGESHYIGPLHPELPDVYAPAGQSNGAIKWAANMPHDAWRDLTAIYIKAYKAGQSTPTVTTDQLIYYYRPNPKDAPCTDPVGKPNGYQFVSDSIFVTAMLTSAGTVTITSGSNAPVTINVPAGIHTVSAPMGIGAQKFALTRNGASILSTQSALSTSSTCTANNFNAYVGTVKR